MACSSVKHHFVVSRRTMLVLSICKRRRNQWGAWSGAKRSWLKIRYPPWPKNQSARTGITSLSSISSSLRVTKATRSTTFNQAGSVYSLECNILKLRKEPGQRWTWLNRRRCYLSLRSSAMLNLQEVSVGTDRSPETIRCTIWVTAPT